MQEGDGAYFRIEYCITKKSVFTFEMDNASENCQMHARIPHVII